MATLYWIGGGANNNWATVANWSTASAGITTASAAPTSVDDVVFDGLGATGNTDSNINSTFTIKSLTITGSYTAAMSHSLTLTIAGNLTFTGSISHPGLASTVINTNSTIKSNEGTWTGTLVFSGASAQITLLGDLRVSGPVSCSNNINLKPTTSESLIILGGLYTSGLLSGSAKVILAGGSWSGGNYGLSCNTDISGSITLPSGYYGSDGTTTTPKPTLRYISGSVQTSGGTLNLGYFGAILDIEPITLNNVAIGPVGAGSTNIFTLSSSLNISGLTTVSGVSTTLNTASLATTASLNVRGGMTVNTGLSGNAPVLWTGGTWTQGATTYGIANNTTISGSVTMSGANTSIQGGTWRFIAGSGNVLTTGNTLVIRGTSVLDVESITWNNFTLGAGTNPITTLSSSVNVGGLVTSANVNTLNAAASNPTASLICRGGLTTSQALSGSAKVVLAGGTWTSAGGANTVSTNIDISGSITVTSPLYGGIAANVLRWITGSVAVAGSTLNIAGSCILDVEPVTWNNVTFGTTSTTALSSSLNVSGSTTVSAATTLNTVGSNLTASLNARGGLAVNQPLGGTAKVVLIGGTWSASGVQAFSNNADISGSITLGTGPCYGGTLTNTLRWVTGSVTVTNSTLTILGSCSLDLGSIVLDNMSYVNNNSFTYLSSSLYVSRSLTTTTVTSVTFTSALAATPASWSCGTLISLQTSPQRIILEANIPYTVRNALTINGAAINTVTLTSNNAVSRSILTLLPGATCNTNANFTRINASQGRTIRTFNGTITDCVNVEQLNDLKTDATSFIREI